MVIAALALFLSLAVVQEPAQEPASHEPAAEAAAPPAPPELGSPAPGHGLKTWAGETPTEVQHSSDGTLSYRINGGKDHHAEISELAGRVILLHVFEPQSESARRATLPLLRDLVAANLDRGIGVLSLMPAAESAAELRGELGIDWPVAIYGEDARSPYLAAGLPRVDTVWVIDRVGRVVWQGQPGAAEKDFLQVVGDALEAPAAPVLPLRMAAELDKAVEAYAEGRWTAAAETAAKVLKAAERGDDDRARLLAEQARVLGALVREQEDALRDAAAEAVRRSRWTTALQLRQQFARGFPRSAGAAALDDALDEVRRGAFGNTLDDAETLVEVLAGRPLLFPARRSKAGDALRKDLERFLRRSANDVEPTQRARYLLERYAAAAD